MINFLLSSSISVDSENFGFKAEKDIVESIALIIVLNVEKFMP